MRRPRFHLLFGALPPALLKTMWRHGGISAHGFHVVPVCLVSGLIRAPNCIAETFRARGAGSRRLDQDPIFIVGHWRSGTTLLHNILSQDESWCYPKFRDVFVPDEMLPSLLDRYTVPLLMRLLPQTRLIDDVPMHQDLPQEEELALAALGAPSFLNAIYFPRKFRTIFESEVLFDGELGPMRRDEWRKAYRSYLGKLALNYPGRRLLLKNPANSARLPELMDMYPGAKFIHIHRNPYEVFISMQKFYQRAWDVLALQSSPETDMAEFVLASYATVMERLMHDSAGLPSDRIATVAYDDLIRQPQQTIDAIYQGLGAPLNAQARDAMARFLAETPLAPPPYKALPDSVAARVYERWRPVFAQFGYNRAQPS